MSIAPASAAELDVLPLRFQLASSSRETLAAQGVTAAAISRIERERAILRLARGLYPLDVEQATQL